ncbi:MAG: AraC family transcriptional regulator [Victivallales bacterium]|nr:AraC family transcriptional regulator [Victivallales bacterium]
MKFKLLPEIISISDRLFDPVWAVKEHKNNAHELLHIIKGNVELTYQNGSKYLGQAGDTLFNPAGVVHRDVFDLESELQVFIIHFNWEDGKEFFETVNNTALAKLSSQAVLEINHIFDAMRLDAGSRELDRTVANSRLMTVLTLIYRDIVSPVTKNDGAGRQALLAAGAKAYIDRHFREPLHLEDIALHLQVSEFYLSRIFSNKSDFSLIEYLTTARLNESKKLLREGRYIVADIARMVGYDDSSYFAKVFKRHVGCAPSKYR